MWLIIPLLRVTVWINESLYSLLQWSIKYYRIALYDKDPASTSNLEDLSDIEPILVLDPKEHPGYYVTSIRLPYLSSNSLG